MKKGIILSMLIALTTAYSFGQKVALQTAINWLGYDELDKAKEAIDQASTNESTSQMAKTWYYRGQIYHAIYESPKEQFKPLKAGSLDEAYKSYEKTLALDTKEEYKDDLMKRISILAAELKNDGVEYYKDKNYSGALQNFEKAIVISNTFFKETDTLAVYNAALSADKSGNTAKAKEMYSRLIDLNYGGPKIYSLLSNMQLADKDTAGALVTLKSARQKYPSNADLSIAELNIYLKTGKEKEAAQQIEAAIVNDPQNSNLYYAKGVLNNNLGNRDIAVEAYKKAIEIKPDNFDANYNLAAMLFNEAAEMINKANALPPSKQKEYDDMKGKAEARFRDSKPYFEAAYQINKNDIATIQSLRQVYARLNEKDKEAEMKKAMEAVKP